MPLLHFYDRATLLAAIDLPLEAELKSLLANRIDHIAGHGLLDRTEIVVVTADTVPAEVIAAVGWWPLVDVDGRCFGDTDFVQPFDHACRAGSRWYLAFQTVGNGGFAFEFIVSVDSDHRLIALLSNLPPP